MADNGNISEDVYLAFFKNFQTLNSKSSKFKITVIRNTCNTCRCNMLERDIEQALVRDVTKLLLELGTGFAFLGNQYPLNVGGDDFYIDLLFYNLNLRCYVVIELKTGDFKPEYAGQLNFYLSAVDGILKKEQDNPSIGLLLCKSKNNVVGNAILISVARLSINLLPHDLCSLITQPIS